MSDKERNIISQLSDTVQTLNKDKQMYILGIVEGMAIAKECHEDIADQGKQLQEV